MKSSAQITAMRNNYTGFRKPTSFALVFLFLITPFAQTFAQEAPMAPDPTPVTDTPVTEPVLSDTAAPDAIAPTTDIAPTDTTITADPVATDQSADTKTTTSVASQTTSSQSTINSSGLLGQSNDSVNLKKIIPEPDQSTGALTFSYPIVIPSGRNNLQPDIVLAYNSQNISPDTLVGYGWSLNIPSIQRLNKTGVDKLYSDNFFSSNFSGELTSLSATIYTPRSNDQNFTYKFDGTSWTLTDKKGMSYKFGVTPQARQDNPASTTAVYKWMLEEVRDTNNNFITYTYYKDGGQVYPDKITYTSSVSATGIFEVNFLREIRADVVKTYNAGFLVTTNYRINEINSKTLGVLTKRYTLGYTTGENGNRSILSTITESGTDETTLSTTALPATSLTNSKASNATFAYTGWTLPGSTSTDGRSLWGDVNGDGFPDILTSFDGANASQVREAYINNGNGTWTPSSAFQPPAAFMSFSPVVSSFGYTLQDINGDGLPDLFRSQMICNGVNCANSSVIYMNTGNGWSLSANTIPVALMYTGYTIADMADFNGDGLPDLYTVAYNFQGQNPFPQKVYLNNGDGTWNDVTSSWSFPYQSGTTAFF